MEIKDGELIFERAFDIEALSSFNCGIRELDLLIHKKNNGLRDFVLHNECDTFFVYYNEILVALFVYSNGTFVTDDEITKQRKSIFLRSGKNIEATT